jgi:hypothetical protein
MSPDASANAPIVHRDRHLGAEDRSVAAQGGAQSFIVVTRTLRLKVRPDSYPWLEAAAIEVTQVWNWCNEISSKAARPYVGKGNG